MDCQSCGACCTNPDENRREGYTAYVDVPASSRLVKNRRFVIVTEAGAHMRLDPSGRCAALKGKLGERVQCQVYADRPRGCRLVTLGDARCLQARRERGLHSS